MTDTPEVVKARNFEMKANPDAVAGQANETFKLVAKPGEALGTGGEKVGFAKYKFQPELSNGLDETNPAKYSMMQNVAGSSAYLFNDGNNSQAEYGTDRGLLTRSVASTAVDRYFATNVVAEERFGTDEHGTAIGISIQADGAGVTGKMDGNNAFLAVNYRDSDIQRGLSDLEANDYLTGQIDRHGGNIFIDTSGPKPKVTGIDNDLAFPEKPRSQVQQNDKWVKEMPRFIHEETAKKILDAKPDDYAAMLKNMPVPDGIEPLSDAAIEQAKQRLIDMQNGIKAGRPEVVAKFDDYTYEVCVQEQEARIKEHLKTQNEPSYDTDQPFKMDQLKPEHSGSMLSCPRTSYVGTTLIQSKAYDIGIKEQAERQQRMAELNASRPLTDAQTDEYAKLERLEQAQQQVGKFTKRPGNSTAPAARDLQAGERNRLRANPESIKDPGIRNAVRAQQKQVVSSESFISGKKAEIASVDRRIDAIEKEMAQPAPETRGNFFARHKAAQEQKAKMAALAKELAEMKAIKPGLETQLTNAQSQLEQREQKLDQLVVDAQASNHLQASQSVNEPVVGRSRSNAVSDKSNQHEEPAKEFKNELSEDDLQESPEVEAKPQLKRTTSNRDILASQHNAPIAPANEQKNDNSNGAKWKPSAKPGGGGNSKIKIGGY